MPFPPAEPPLRPLCLLSVENILQVPFLFPFVFAIVADYEDGGSESSASVSSGRDRWDSSILGRDSSQSDILQAEFSDLLHLCIHPVETKLGTVAMCLES